MLDFSLSKMALIGVVALVVIGPKKLPGVARTVGALLGRAQRYVNDVKTEVIREIELDALRKVKSDFDDAARSVQTSIHEHMQPVRTDLTDPWNNDAGGSSMGDAAHAGMTSATWGGARRGSAGAPSRKHWRVKRTATPLWYKRLAKHRTRVQSGAARVARHTPQRLRRPIRFL